MGTSKELVFLCTATGSPFDIQQANILISSDTPARACLADFGFMTMIPDPGEPMSFASQSEGGTMTFMSPELLVPSRFGLKDSMPTSEADIYAFGLVIFQVCANRIMGVGHCLCCPGPYR